MTPFLQQVARHYCPLVGNDGGRLLFVLPSQRAAVFFERYFALEVARSGGGPVIAPRCLPIDRFFAALSPLQTADRITLLLELYDCYKALRPGCESLDDFVFWGDMILSDYGDVDKYLVDPHELFRNVSDLKSISDDYSYLSDNQREAVTRFLGLFKTGGTYKERFSSLWALLAPMYDSFNERLSAKGLAYDGKLLRSIATRLDKDGGSAIFKEAFPESEKVVFCGLNALNECEKKILSSLHTLGLAEFCWDWESDWIRDEANQSSRFLKDNVRLYPQAFPLEKCDSHPEFEIVSLPSGIGQTRLLASIFEDGSIPMDERTAVVLPDEALLLPLLSSLPPKVRNVNVTMGFPMVSSSFYSLMDYVMQMQLCLRQTPDGAAFYHRPLWAIASNNIFTAIADEKTLQILDSLRAARRYYVKSADISGTRLLDVIFRPAADMGGYLLEILDFIGKEIASKESLEDSLSLEMDFAMEYSKAVRLLSDKKLDVRAQTWVSLLKGLLSQRSVPFKGEPLVGLQIMGPLETRALDFDKLIILSCNEGVFPRHNVASSFIPPLLRRGFDMPTYEYQDAVWAYYFYRMVQRPSKVWMISDSRGEGLKSGEESRYIKQLQYHFEAPLVRRNPLCIPKAVALSESIPKTPEHIALMHSKALSATAIKAYLACPAKFYYSFIEGLSLTDEVAESLDEGMKGNVFHKVMQELYDGRGEISLQYLESLCDEDSLIRSKVEAHILEELGSDEIHGRDIVTSSLLQKYVKSTLGRDMDFLKASRRDHFDILGLEKHLEAPFGEFRLKGFLDRLDSFAEGTVRIVDYKTGRVLKTDTGIDDSSAEKIVKAIFDPATLERPEIALQFFIYDYLLRASGLESGALVQNCVYSTRKILSEAPENRYLNEKFYGLMTEALASLLEEMASPEVPFSRCEGRRSCEYCDFKTICGR